MSKQNCTSGDTDWNQVILTSSPDRNHVTVPTKRINTGENFYNNNVR